jgi:hypothetical protein
LPKKKGSKYKMERFGVGANEQAVWKVYPEATFWGVDDKSKFPIPENCACEVYESEDINAKVIGSGDTYEEAWADARKNLPKRKPCLA